MLWISLGLILVLGAMTLLLHDKRFIMWKPTVLYWIFAAALAIAPFAFNRNLVKALFAKMELQLPEPLWGRLNLVWILFLAAMGVLNLYVAYNFSESTWVNFKLFGTTGLTFLFFLGHVFVLQKYMVDKEHG